MHEPSIPIGHGLKLVASAHMSDIVEDWSQVRSPGRAKRRRKAGKPQRITAKTIPQKKAVIDHATGTVYAHPAVLRDLRVRLEEERALDRDLSASPLPDPRRMEADLFAFGHIGIWGYEAAQYGGRRSFRHKAFDRFPDLMGGDLTQLAIYRQAERSGPHVRWNLPIRQLWRADGPRPDIPTVAFRIERMACARHVKDVLCFADETSEATFRRHLLKMRRDAAHDDLRWGFTELSLTPARRLFPDMAWVV